ncbi:MAG: 4'-phosphopantetheinyl transferase superfamily protein, partial [Terracidiphilus sp.]
MMKSMLPLAPSEIHLWLTFYDGIDDKSLHSDYRKLLSNAEREQEPRFYFASDRRRYLLTRVLVRTVLSRYLPVSPGDWVFANNAYGRPDVVNMEANKAGFSFNISHSHGLIVLAVAKRRALGVDVVNLRSREVSMDIASRYFAPAEVAVLRSTPNDQRNYRFLEYWSFKEAYVKARGMGFSLPLDKFSFYYPQDRAVTMKIDPELGDDASRWQLWQFCPAPEYLAAVCAERVEGQYPQFILRRTVPMLSEQQYPLEMLRVSD